MSANTAFRRRARRALADSRLQDNLRKATDTALEKRRRLAEEIPDYDALRRRVGEIRREGVERRVELLAEARERLEAGGIHTYLAADAEEARRLVLEIAGGAKRFVKGKSMVSEEIELASFLEAAGGEALETDLGEFIVQLLGEPPSHITAPALHLDRRQIARLFHERLDAEYCEDPETLTAVARAHLRTKFLAAEVGITGANFVVAETGTIVLLENEGNIGLASTLPPLHIAVTGIEKLVPRLADLDPLLRILPPNGTGQRAVSYVSLIGGPSPEGDGPGERHLIFVDNGRSRLAARPDGEALACIRCGSCLNVCPIFRRVGGHGYASIYPGPVGILLSPFLLEDGDAHLPATSLADACSLCGACAELCPVEIPLPDLILAARREKAPRSGGAQRLAWRLFGRVMARPRAFRAAAALARLVPGPLLGLFVPAWSRGRITPSLARRPFRVLLKRERER